MQKQRIHFAKIIDDEVNSLLLINDLIVMLVLSLFRYLINPSTFPRLNS